MPVRRSRTVKPIPERASPFWYALLLAALIGVLAPLDARAPLFAPALVEFDLAGYGRAVAQQVYLGIKAGMLWVPLGFLASLAGWDRALRRWAPAAVALLALGLPMLPEVRVGDALELLFALPGLALGLWLGRATRDGGGLRSTVSPRAEAVSARARHPTVSEHDTAFAGKESVPPTQARETAEGAAAFAHAGPLRLLAGFAVLLAVTAGLWDFPRWPLLLGLGLTLYAALLWFRPLAWLVAVPAALPLFDLAPWTGRFFLDEFDLLMAVTLAVLLLRRPAAAPRPPPLSRLALMGVFGLSVLAALAVGLLPLAPLDANAFSSYWSSYNALRVAKGFAWGALLYLWIRRAGVDRQALGRLLALGMGLGLLGVGLVGAWEHHLFVGFAQRLETYRIVSTFFSMHTGGGHIEAYLAAALPFLWLVTQRVRDALFTLPLMLLTAYVMVYTVSRGGVLAAAVVVLILAVASLRAWRVSRRGGLLAPLSALVLVGLVVAAGVGGGHFQQRFADTARDWGIRMDHWSRAVALADDGIVAGLFGSGLGSFPRRHLERAPAEDQPATFGFAREGDNSYFRLGSGATVYYAQRIAFTAGEKYRLELDARSRQGDTRLDTPVCEKQLLNSRQCEWGAFNVPGDGQWHRLSREFTSAEVGKAAWFRRPPVELILYHAGKSGVVDVDNLRLLGPDGRDALCNGDFRAGGDCWFFKTHSHLPWHIKNLWVHVWFEQGWLGLLAFAGLSLTAVLRLARAGWRGHRLAWAWLASLAGLLTVGIFDSLLDAPRLAALLVALLLLGAGYDWRGPGLPGGRGARRSSAAPASSANASQGQNEAAALARPTRLKTLAMGHNT